MTLERDEELAILEALESLDDLDEVGQPRRQLDGESREHLELLGMLPYTLDQEPLRPSLKSEVMARVTGSGGQAEQPEIRESMTEIKTLGGVSHFQGGSSRTEAPRASVWTWALAAMLGLCALGLTFLAGRVQEQSAMIAQLREQAHHDGPSPSAMHDQFELIRAIAPQVYPLQPSANQVAAVNARGMIYVCPNHQRWYLTIKGLPPTPEGQEYHFWFKTDDGAVSGGPLAMSSDDAIVLEASAMPRGTGGFTVTLEPEGLDPDSRASQRAPVADRVVLEADQAISL